MKILIIAEENTRNEYIDLLAASLRNVGNEVVCSITDFALVDSSFDIVHVHWLEALTQWEIPVEDDVSRISELLREWHKVSSLVYTFHNEQPHDYLESALVKAIKTCLFENIQGVIHLGKFSYEKTMAYYSKISHCIIPHGSYPVDESISKDTALERLSLSLDGFKVLIFGSVRNLSERYLIYRTYKKLIRTHEVSFIIPGWGKTTHPSWKTHPGKRLFSIILDRLAKKQSGLFLKYDECLLINSSVFFRAADVTFLPRINSINSGVLFLSLSYGVPIVGPNIGNMKEFILDSDNFIYKSNNVESAVSALITVFDSENLEDVSTRNKLYAHDNLDWDIIGQQHVNFYTLLLKS